MPNAYLCIQNLNAPVYTQCPSEHSKWEISGRKHYAHLSIRNLNVPVEYPTPNAPVEWPIEIWMHRWNVQCPSAHSKSECSDGSLNAYLCIRNLNAPVECKRPICAFEIWMLPWNVQCTSVHSKSECSDGTLNAHLCIRNLNAPKER